jgi:hypothetical protein
MLRKTLLAVTVLAAFAGSVAAPALAEGRGPAVFSVLKNVAN